MQLGFVSAILADLDLKQVVDFAARAGFACVELMCWPRGRAERRYAGVTHLDVTEFGAAEAERVRALAAARGVAISALGYYPNPLAPDPDEAAACSAHIRKVMAASALLGVGRLNTF